MMKIEKALEIATNAVQTEKHTAKQDKALAIEAEKNGCDICKRISRVFDGREIVYDKN